MKRANAADRGQPGVAAALQIVTNKRVTRSRAAAARETIRGQSISPTDSNHENAQLATTGPFGGRGLGRGRGRDRGRHRDMSRGRGRGGRGHGHYGADPSHEITPIPAATAVVMLEPQPTQESQATPVGPSGTPLHVVTEAESQAWNETRWQPSSRTVRPVVTQPLAEMPQSDFTSARDLASQSARGKRRIYASRIRDVPPLKPPAAGRCLSGEQIFSQVSAPDERSATDGDGDEMDEFMECGEMSEYTQRTKFPMTPGPEENPRLSLGHPDYGLPFELVSNLAKLGINSIYPWQAACLLGRGHLTHEKNLVYSAPTGGGKSLVADVLMLKRVLQSDKKALLVLPYVALVQEKMKWLRKVCEGLKKVGEEEEGPWDEPRSHGQDRDSVRVAGFYGSSRSRASWRDTDIAVCTIEKANTLVNNAIEEHSINEIGIVVTDEMHMLDDEQRGYLIEIMATKLLLLRQDTQLVAMSATLSNTEILARWLHANYYISKYKPIPIEEHIVYSNSIYSAADSKQFFAQVTAVEASKTAQPPAEERSAGAVKSDRASSINGVVSHDVVSSTLDQELAGRVRPVRVVDRSEHRQLQPATLNAMVALAIETAEAGYGALVFCGSRQACQNNALLLADAMPPIPELDDDLIERRRDIIASLTSVPSGLDPGLAKTVMRGVGYHHAGLTTEEREIVAEGYDKGVLRIMVATCSLAAGINLPARRVILCGARMGRDLVGPVLLRQMRGRAGRKGKDEVGETYLCCVKEDLTAIGELFQSDMPAIASGLTPERRGVKRALLEAVATQLVSSHDSIQEYLQCTLLYQSMDLGDLRPMAEEAVKELVASKLLEMNEDGSLEATRLGSAVVAASLSPEDGLRVHYELKKGLKSFVMDGDFHVFYMFTPLQTNVTAIDWAVFRDQISVLDDSNIRAMILVGAKPAVINSASQTGQGPGDENELRIYHRAYTTLQLRELSNEVPISIVAEKYKVPRGSVQSLAQTCQGFAWSMVKFCQRMGWDMLAVVLDHMRDRLEARAKADLLEMAQVAFVKGHTARVLWDNGFKSVKALAEADAKDLVPVLLQAQPRRTPSTMDASAPSQQPDRLQRKLAERAEIIIASANRVWERDVGYVEVEE